MRCSSSVGGFCVFLSKARRSVCILATSLSTTCTLCVCGLVYHVHYCALRCVGHSKAPVYFLTEKQSTCGGHAGPLLFRAAPLTFMLENICPTPPSLASRVGCCGQLVGNLPAGRAWRMNPHIVSRIAESRLRSSGVFGASYITRLLLKSTPAIRGFVTLENRPGNNSFPWALKITHL